MTETPPFSPTIALLTVAARWQERVADALKPLDLTLRKYALLGHVRATPGISFSELARRSRITAASAHIAVGALKKAGLVTDATARAGAASRLEVTSRGQDLLADAAERVADLDRAFSQEHIELTDALRVHMLATFAGIVDL
ncbi:MarR family winged helix-turn-helix transcriptional regulator [Microbacterium sp. UFMG61]|uniref:MarR family winged helix-turn-helix transcriptional regulator n=1 Tax=Microbacterium sp. UFMG61 TaxID=2745935 RepID=UPI00188FACE5|nr:helix-turn-helix domain-containing protein [Microbacterium sp. UFMG61]